MSPMLITILAFVTVTGVMAAVLFMGTAKSPVEQRLKKMLPDGAPEAAEARKAHEGSLIKTALAALGNYGVGGGDSGLSRKLSTAGVRGPRAPRLGGQAPRPLARNGGGHLVRRPHDREHASPVDGQPTEPRDHRR